MSKILVIGANGTVGSELVRLLTSRGQSVVKASRRASTAPDQVQLDLVSGTGMEHAFDGTGRAFLLSPPGHVNQDELLIPVIDQAVRSGVEKIVLMTAMGANADEAAPLRKVELALERSGLAWNTIRPNWFMQNFHTYWVEGILRDAAIGLPVGDAKGSFIDARDIASVAAELLVSSAHDNQAFDLTGAVALDHHEVAAILSKETGRSIRFEDVSPEVMRGRLLNTGLPAAYADFLLMILGFFRAGYSERTTTAVQDITGRAPREFAAYARDHRQAWLAATAAA